MWGIFSGIWQVEQAGQSEILQTFNDSHATWFQKTLFSNFHTKWNVLEMGMKSAKNKDPYNNYSPSGARAKPIKDFYTSTKTNEKERLSDDDKKRW